MCLDTITSTSPTSEGVGYKVFRKKGRLLCGEWTSGKRPTKQWLKSAGDKSTGGATKIKGYGYGFHIYKFLQHANIHCSGSEEVRKIRYRKAFVVGGYEPGFGYIVVAKEIYIIPGEIR